MKFGELSDLVEGRDLDVTNIHTSRQVGKSCTSSTNKSTMSTWNLSHQRREQPIAPIVCENGPVLQRLYEVPKAASPESETQQAES